VYFTFIGERIIQKHEPKCLVRMKILGNLFLAVWMLALGFGCKRAESESKMLIPLTMEEEAYYLKTGQQIAQSTFVAMSSRLQAAMAEGGVARAAAYCNTAALPIADSMSAIYGAQIRRTSLKIRNPEDRPTKAEQVALERYAALDASNVEMKPSVALLDDKTIGFYAPIRVNGACLACHGELGSTMQEKDYTHLKRLYPSDQAIGYVDGDWRGLWSITIERKSNK
jgi:hypothetical protein